MLLIRQSEDSRTLAGSPLAQDLRGGTRPVRAAAARAMGRIGDPAALDPLINALRHEDSVEVRREIAFALGILGQSEAVPVLIDELDSEVDAETSAEIAIALGRIGDPTALDALHALLASSWGLIRERAIEAMALLADEASVEALVGMLQDPDPGVAWRAAYALEKIPGTTQVDALIVACGTDETMLQRAAVRSLGRLEAATAVDRIVALSTEPHDDWQLEVRIADALGRIGKDSTGVLSLMSALLESDVFHVRVSALQAIGRAGWRELLPDVLDLRSDPVVDVRAAAYDTTADCLDGRTMELLLPGLEDESPLVAATCLRRLGESTEEDVVTLLLDAVANDEDRIRRLGAAEGLAAGGERVDLVHILSLLNDRDPYVATVAAGALGERQDAEAVPHLMATLDRADPGSADIRLAAATALGQIGEPRATGILRTSLAQDPDPRIRLAARDALELLLPPEEAVGLPTAEDLAADIRPVARSLTQPEIVDQSTATQLILHTDRGRVVIDLLGADAPQMVESFARLAEDGFFNSLSFHRVVGDFVVQGGDPTGTGWGDAGYTLRSEWNPRRYHRGSVGIAHSGKDTGSCQLFIAQAPQPHLDARYTIWGEVVIGMDVVDRIQRGDRFSAEVVRNDSGR
jgi:HEAT repeat protein